MFQHPHPLTTMTCLEANMDYITLPAADFLNKLLCYDKDSGVLTWKERTADMFKAGFHPADTSCMRWNTKHTVMVSAERVAVEPDVGM